MKNSCKRQIALKLTKFLFSVACIAGFLYQTSDFFFLYWTYPTVVDIQQIEPTYLEMPSFSICNTIGYNFQYLCGFPAKNVAPCLPKNIHHFSADEYCRLFPRFCFGQRLPEDLRVVTYTRFMSQVSLKPEDHLNLSTKLEDYMSCEIEFAGETTKCDLENVMGSMYSKEDLPMYCFAIYSLWGKPNKKRAQIPKGSVMHFQFVLNSTNRPENSNQSGKPLYVLPGDPSVQIAVHSPYSLPSPILDGMSFLGGRAYEVRLKMNERHLLPSPYQTNCTDYMQVWRQRGGRGPVDQMSALQECRVNKTYEAEGCVPLTLNFPHNYDVCRNCFSGPCNFSTFAEECGKMAEIYTQPCESIAYETDKQDRVITKFEKIASSYMRLDENIRQKLLAHDCEGNRMFRKECSTIDVYFLFDRFEITNLTYNAKFESLELFSVIGGYMGMWLGVSLLAVYDFIGTIIVMARAYAKKRQDKTRIQKIKKDKFKRNDSFDTDYRNYASAKHVNRRRY